MIGFNGGLIGKSRTTSSADSNPGAWTMSENAAANSLDQWPPSLDPDFSSVPLLLRGDGANNGTTFTNSSASGLSATRAGNAVTSTAQSKFGGSSLYFPNDSVSWLSFPDDSSLRLLGNDFTIEAWCFFMVSSREFFFWNGNASAYGGLRLLLDSSANIQLLASTNGTAHTTNVTATNVVSLNTWYHIAASRAGTSCRVFVNGSQVINTNVGTLNNGGINNIGGRSAFASSLGGYIDEFRFTSGIARYQSAFTPTARQFPSR